MTITTQLLDYDVYGITLCNSTEYALQCNGSVRVVEIDGMHEEYRYTNPLLYDDIQTGITYDDNNGIVYALYGYRVYKFGDYLDYIGYFDMLYRGVGLVYNNNKLYTCDVGKIRAFETNGDNATKHNIDLNHSNVNPVDIVYNDGVFLVLDANGTLYEYNHKHCTNQYNINTPPTTRGMTLHGTILHVLTDTRTISTYEI